jgi:hypothetical protein
LTTWTPCKGTFMILMSHFLLYKFMFNILSQLTMIFLFWFHFHLWSATLKLDVNFSNIIIWIDLKIFRLLIDVRNFKYIFPWKKRQVSLWWIRVHFIVLVTPTLISKVAKILAFDQCLTSKVVKWLWAHVARIFFKESYCDHQVCDHNSLMERCCCCLSWDSNGKGVLAKIIICWTTLNNGGGDDVSCIPKSQK